MFFANFAVWLLSLFSLPALQDNIDVDNNNILQVCKRSGALTFVKYASSTLWVKQALENGTGYMALAPSDRAFDRLPPAVKTALQDPHVLEWYMRYHIALTVAYEKEINNNLRIPSAFRPPGKTEDQPEPVLTIRFNVYDIESDATDHFDGSYGKTVTASGARILLPDIQASNGLVHIIDKVMFPIPTGNNMPEFLNHDPRFSTLYKFLKKVNLTMALKTDPSQPLTIFAPSNTAFNHLPKDVVQKLSSNTTFLEEVLKYHVVNGAFYAAGLYDNQRLESLIKKEILVLRGPGGIYVHNQKVVQADNTVTNGVIHEVSGVLIPSSK